MEYAIKEKKKINKKFKITIKATHKYNSKFDHIDTSWIFKKWDAEERDIRFNFKCYGYLIKWKATFQKGHIDVHDDTLIITVDPSKKQL